MARVKTNPVKKCVGKPWAKLLKLHKSTKCVNTTPCKIMNCVKDIPRKRPGEKAVRDPRRYAASDQILLQKAPFGRLVKEITQDLFPGIRFQSSALEALRTVSEAHLVQVFADAKLCANHAERPIVTVKDIRLAYRLAHT